MYKSLQVSNIIKMNLDIDVKQGDFVCCCSTINMNDLCKYTTHKNIYSDTD